MNKLKVFLTKIWYWEHWPALMFYIPLFPYYIYQAIKSRHIVFYLAANPGIKFSGNGAESKYETLLKVPKAYRPTTILIAPNSQITTIVDDIKNNAISFPLIAKPDVGFRGYLVKKINNISQLEDYFQKVDVPVILQEFIDYPKECGIFFHRVPGNAKGHITSITLKKFLTVTGDGQKNLKELIKQDNRAVLYLSLFENLHQNQLDDIIIKGKIITLSQIGNHSKGTTFINGNDLITPDLESLINNFSNHINGWNFGRIDLKYHSMEEMLSGKPFKVLEINGILSEPTHIYDPTKSSYFSAVNSLRIHWGILSHVARKSHQIDKVPYTPFKSYLNNMLWLRRYSNKLKRINKRL